MAYTTIDDPSEYFTTTLYTGNGNDNRGITNSANAGNFQPDWLWYKERSSTSSHRVFDSSRGASKRIEPDTTTQEETDTSNQKSFDSNGFTVGTSGSTNANGDTYVAWQWKANGGTATATISESGSNPAASVQANTTAGFSIITYTGTGSQGTIAHGLGATPKFIVAKNRDAGEGWIIDSSIITGNSNGTLHFNTDGEYTGGSNQFGAHSSTNITIKTAGNINTDGQKYVAYCFAEKQGYSKFGFYEGNGNNDGTFVYLGFKPAWFMCKSIDTANSDQGWNIFDTKRDGYNVDNDQLLANDGGAEVTTDRLDILSNGVKMRNSGTQTNSAQTYIYIAFAENPFVSSKGVPTTAR